MWPMGEHVVIVAAEFNRAVTAGLVAGAVAALHDEGIDDAAVVWVPGSWELPPAAQAAALAGADAVVALGAVIKGETDHYEHIASETIGGLMDVMLGTGVPIGMGVLTSREAHSAVERSAPGPANKGAEAAQAALGLLGVLRDLEADPSR